MVIELLVYNIVRKPNLIKFLKIVILVKLVASLNIYGFESTLSIILNSIFVRIFPLFYYINIKFLCNTIVGINCKIKYH